MSYDARVDLRRGHADDAGAARRAGRDAPRHRARVPRALADARAGTASTSPGRSPPTAPPPTDLLRAVRPLRHRRSWRRWTGCSTSPRTSSASGCAACPTDVGATWRTSSTAETSGDRATGLRDPAALREGRRPPGARLLRQRPQAPGAINATRAALVNFAMAATLLYLCGGMSWVPGGRVARARDPQHAGHDRARHVAGRCRDEHGVDLSGDPRLRQRLRGADARRQRRAGERRHGGLPVRGWRWRHRVGHRRATVGAFATMTLDELTGGGGARAIGRRCATRPASRRRPARRAPTSR